MSHILPRISNLRRRIRKWPVVARKRALQERGWYDLAARSDAPGIFVGGCGRSGTTLFQVLLNRHKNIFCGPETSMYGLPFRVENIGWVWGIPVEELQAQADRSANLVEFSAEFYATQAAQAGKKRWADKTPNNVRAISELLTWFPNGRFIHILRDGRDVACSLRHHPKERMIKGKLVKVNTVNPISVCAGRWLQDTATGFAYRSHPRYMEVRYEELVEEPERELRRVCEFIGEDFDPAMLREPSGPDDKLEQGRLLNNRNASQSISSSSIGRWRRDLTPAERKAFADVAGELLIVAGYVKDQSWISE